MPDKSKAMWRAMFAKEARGDLKPGIAEEFARATPGGYRALPERVSKKKRRVIP